MQAANLYNALCQLSIEEAKNFLDNKQDNGEFGEFDEAQEIMVDANTLDYWLSAFASHLEIRAQQDDVDPVVIAEPIDSATIGIGEFIQQIEDLPAQQVKRMLIEYFGESTHQGWDGWQPYEALVLERFMRDFSYSLEATKDYPKEHWTQPVSIFSVDVKKVD